MAFIQYLSQAESKPFFNSFAPKLENYGMNIPKKFRYSKQLYAEFNIPNKNYSKINSLISWVNQTKETCSVEILSDEQFLQNKTLCRKVIDDISKLIKPMNLYSKIK
ncbi:hypothetical protein [Prochlorococcus marinus]|uniref:hypothetical protein n=1 Tax=Prochlorococcus marinus TaxID=1219 RepID=UPI000190093D|nr:hypothetical protein [Prochlorococcus marinus]EEE40306.1 conserved hypothetical protein [Prochlorococcus marinus str. MIT 9202]